MRFSFNFAHRVDRMTPYLAGFFMLIGIVMFIISFLLIISAREISDDILDVANRLERYKSHEIKQPTVFLSEESLSELRNRVHKVNEITSTSGQALPLLLTRLESLLPDGVWVVTLQYRAVTNDSKLVAEAYQAEQLTEFMGRLEQSGDFSQVLLTHQTKQSDNTNAIQFEIQLRSKM